MVTERVMCDACHEGRHRACTREAWDGPTLVACGCRALVHIAVGGGEVDGGD